jgi:hypothetical protein
VSLYDSMVPLRADRRSGPLDLSNEEGPRSKVTVHVSGLL